MKILSTPKGMVLIVTDIILAVLLVPVMLTGGRVPACVCGRDTVVIKSTKPE